MTVPGPDGPARVFHILYEGWRSVEKKSAHSFEDLHSAIERACAAAVNAWGWSPEGLTLQFHTRAKAMGRALASGTRPPYISLHLELLTHHRLDTIARVVIHELCHHAREELHPRRRMAWSDSHDELFRTMLLKADPLAEQDHTCFSEDVDTETVARSGQVQGVVFSREAGLLRVGFARGGKMRIRWDPKPGTRGWRSTWAPFYADTFAVFLRQFPRDQRPRLVLSYEPGEYKSRLFGNVPKVMDLNQFMAALSAHYSPQSAWVKEVSEAMLA